MIVSVSSKRRHSFLCFAIKIDNILQNDGQEMIQNCRPDAVTSVYLLWRNMYKNNRTTDNIFFRYTIAVTDNLIGFIAFTQRFFVSLH